MDYFTCKIPIIGDGSVGKTSIKRKYMGKSFVNNHIPTIGADVGSVEIEVNEYFSLKAQLWDLAGQKKFINVRRKFYQNSSALIMVYDITNRKSFTNLSYWFAEFCEYHDKDLPMIIIGNKIDLENDRDVENDAVEELIKYLKDTYSLQDSLVINIETSALTGENISDAFSILGERLYAYKINRDKNWRELDKRKSDKSKLSIPKPKERTGN